MKQLNVSLQMHISPFLQAGKTQTQMQLCFPVIASHINKSRMPVADWIIIWQK